MASIKVAFSNDFWPEKNKTSDFGARIFSLQTKKNFVEENRTNKGFKC
jgi:hypothetical protein